MGGKSFKLGTEGLFSDLLRAYFRERYVFVSYHHAGDQFYYDQLARVFNHDLCPITNNSIEFPFESDNPDYIIQGIRDQHISGTSCTIVLCGRDTPWRKYVDWETKATLDKSHGLLGVVLPTARQSAEGRPIVPARLHDNIESGFAPWLSWDQIAGIGGLQILKIWIEFAKTAPDVLARNNRPLMKRNEAPPSDFSAAMSLLMALNRGAR